MTKSPPRGGGTGGIGYNSRKIAISPDSRTRRCFLTGELLFKQPGPHRLVLQHFPFDRFMVRIFEYGEPDISFQFLKALHKEHRVGQRNHSVICAMKGPEGYPFIRSIEVMPDTAAGDRNNRGKSFRKLRGHRPCTEPSPAITNQIDALAIHPMIGHHRLKNTRHALDRIEQFLTRILRREHQKRKIAAFFNQFRQAAAAQLFDVAAALIAAMQPDDKRIGLIRTGLVLGRVEQIVDIRRDGDIGFHRLLFGLGKSRGSDCGDSDQAKFQMLHGLVLPKRASSRGAIIELADHRVGSKVSLQNEKMH